MNEVILKKYGSGEKTLLCFPGWVHPVENEKKFLKLLSKKYTVYSVWLPGYMDNRDSAFTLSFKEVARLIDKEIKELGLTNVNYLGFSMGCILIMELDKFFPRNNKKIFIGSPVLSGLAPSPLKLIVENPILVKLFRRLKPLRLAFLNKVVRTMKKNDKARFKIANGTEVGAFDSLVGLLNSSDRFKYYVNKALFIYGEQGRYLKLAQQFKIKNLVIIKQATHNCVTGHEDQILKLVNSYLGSD